MAIGAGTIWRVRIGGADTNAGCFDPTVSGAGTDYTDQDSPQLSVTDLACSGTPWTTLTSATGGFTSAMIGNGIVISGGSNFTAGRYIITGRTDTNTITVDRAAGATGACSGGTGKVGGAMASMLTPNASGYAVDGNIIYVRGQGSNNPSGVDYALSSYISGVAGVSYVGYNGRPKVSYTGILLNACTRCTISNFSFVMSAASYTTFGVISGTGGGNLLYDCVVDQAGFDATMLTSASAINCSFINTGTQTVGTKYTIVDPSGQTYGEVIKNCLIKDQRFGAISGGSFRTHVLDTVIQNCGGNAIYIGLTGANNAGLIMGNTVYGGKGHGIVVPTSKSTVLNNNIYGITESGKYAIYITDAVVRSAINTIAHTSRNNIYGCTLSSNVALSTLALAIDPQFVNAPTDLTPTNTGLRILAGIGSL